MGVRIPPERIRQQAQKDLQEGAPKLLRAILLAEKLRLGLPSVLGGIKAVDIVAVAFELMLSGKQPVASYSGGLLSTVRHLIEQARESGTFKTGIPVAPSASVSMQPTALIALITLLGAEPELWPIAEGILLGKKIRQLANELHIARLTVLYRMRRVRAIAAQAATFAHSPTG